MPKKNNRAIRRLRKQSEPKKLTYFSAFALEVLNRVDIAEDAKTNFRGLFRAYQAKLKDTSFSFDLDLTLKALDTAFQREPKSISCQKNCSACCHQKVDVLKPEQDRIINFIKINKISFNIDNLKNQKDCPDEEWQSLPFDQRGCIFLDSDGACKIYEVRPISCRRYYVTSKPEFCVTEDRGNIDYSSHPDCDAIISVLLNKYCFSSLPKFIAGKFKKLTG